jgi:hypothetical protein
MFIYKKCFLGKKIHTLHSQYIISEKHAPMLSLVHGNVNVCCFLSEASAHVLTAEIPAALV